jgi:hypothetical protein
MEYFSLRFKYASAPRGWSAPGIHIQFRVDEDAESKLLSYVERVAYNAAKVAGLELHHQYSWPDGSCYKWVVTESRSVFDERLRRLQRILASPWMSVCIAADSSHVSDPAVDHGGGMHLNLVDRIAGKPMLYYDHSFEPTEPRSAWGGMSNGDWVRYREHQAFKDGFTAAFGHDVDFWHGGHEGYAPSVRAQELAGAGYCLGRLFKLLNY